MKYITVEFYEVFAAGIIGMVLQMLVKGRAIQQKALKANEVFTFGKYVREDWMSHSISAFAVLLFMLFVRRRVHDIPQNLYEFVLAVSATVGYSGADLVSRFFSASNRRINDIINQKSNIADDK